MSEIEAAFSTAQEVKLKASADLAALVGSPVKVYRSVPANKGTPYIVIGEDQFLEDGEGDDGCQDATEVFSTVQAWIKPSVLSDVTPRQVAGVIRRILNADLDIDGHRTVEYKWESTTTRTDPDGSQNVRLTFRYQTEPL